MSTATGGDMALRDTDGRTRWLDVVLVLGGIVVALVFWLAPSGTPRAAANCYPGSPDPMCNPPPPPGGGNGCTDPNNCSCVNNVCHSPQPAPPPPLPPPPPPAGNFKPTPPPAAKVTPPPAAANFAPALPSAQTPTAVLAAVAPDPGPTAAGCGAGAALNGHPVQLICASTDPKLVAATKPTGGGGNTAGEAAGAGLVLAAGAAVVSGANQKLKDENSTKPPEDRIRAGCIGLSEVFWRMIVP